MKFKIVKREKRQGGTAVGRNKKQRRRKRSRGATVFYIVLSGFIVAGAVYLCLTMLFNVDRINIVGNTLYSERDIIETSGISKGQNLFEVNTGYAADKLYSVYSYIEKAEVKRNFPNAVTITITEAQPFAVIEEADGYTLISSKGKVLERNLEEAPYGTVTVRGMSTVSGSEDDRKRLELLNKIMAAMQEFEMENYSFIDLSDTLEIVMVCADRIKVVLGNELELEYKLQFVNEVVTEKLPKTGFYLVDASTAGRVMTKEMTMSPWDSLQKTVGTGFADEDEE